MKNMITLLLLCAMVSLEGCDLFKNDQEPKTELEKLPPITQTGENTFGCLVNGEAFVVTNTSRMSAIYQGIYQKSLSVSGEIDNAVMDANVSMFIGNPIVEGQEYQLHNNSTHRGRYLNQVINCTYETSDLYRGYIYIYKFDSLKFIISGTFEFEAISTGCQDTVRITDGRFDMQYIP